MKIFGDLWQYMWDERNSKVLKPRDGKVVKPSTRVSWIFVEFEMLVKWPGRDVEQAVFSGEVELGLAEK